jgi:uncharacterized protein involved in exopolysaccharide biosynthesis
MPGETFGSILGAIYRRRLTVVLVMAGALAGGFFFQRQIGPDFLARATIMIPGAPPTMSLSSEGANVPNGPYLPDLSDELKVGAMGVLTSGAVHERMAQKHPDLALRAFRKNLRGNIDRFGNMEVMSYAPDARRAASFANDFADCFQDEMQALVEASMRNSLEVFRVEEPLALERYRVLHQGLVDYLAEVNSADLDAELKQLIEDRRKLEGQLLELEISRVRADAERPVIERSIEARPEYLESKITYARNPAYEKALERTRELSAQLALMRFQYQDVHPEVQRLQAALDLVRSDAVELLKEEMVLQSRSESLDDLGQKLVSRLTDLDITAAGYETQHAILLQRRAALDERLRVIPAYISAVGLRNADMSNARNLWQKISERRAELEFHLRNGVRFTIMSPAMRARPENAKQVPTTGGLYLFCLIAGLAGGLLTAVFAELLARMRASRPF